MVVMIVSPLHVLRAVEFCHVPRCLSKGWRRCRRRRGRKGMRSSEIREEEGRCARSPLERLEKMERGARLCTHGNRQSAVQRASREGLGPKKRAAGLPEPQARRNYQTRVKKTSPRSVASVLPASATHTARPPTTSTRAVVIVPSLSGHQVLPHRTHPGPLFKPGMCHFHSASPSVISV